LAVINDLESNGADFRGQFLNEGPLQIAGSTDRTGDVICLNLARDDVIAVASSDERNGTESSSRFHEMLPF
jgi:hypothetical protein